MLSKHWQDVSGQIRPSLTADNEIVVRLAPLLVMVIDELRGQEQVLHKQFMHRFSCYLTSVDQKLVLKGSYRQHSNDTRLHRRPMFKIWKLPQVMVAKMHRSGSGTDVGDIWERSNHQLTAKWQIVISETTLNKCWTAWILPTPLAFLLQYQTHGCSGKTCLTSRTLTASEVGCTCLHNNKLNNSSI